MKYLANFDGLRAIAILLVLLVHLSYGNYPGGVIGVDLFFVLSGFLITTIIADEFARRGTISFRAFYLKRALRLLPALFACLILSALIWPFTTNQPQSSAKTAIFSAVFYFANLVDEKTMGMLAHCWSLAVEEHYYFVWPIFSALLFKYFSRAGQVSIVCLCIIAVVLFRAIIYQAHYFDVLQAGFLKTDAYRFTFCRIDGLLLGSVLALIPKISKDKIKAWRYSKPLLVAMLLVLLVLGVFLDINKAYMYIWGFVLVDVISAGIVFLAASLDSQRYLSNQYLLWLGRRSYGLYLYHYPVYFITENLRVAGSLMNFALVSFVRLVVSILLVWLSYKYVETPALRYKEKYQRRIQNLQTQNVFFE